MRHLDSASFFQGGRRSSSLRLYGSAMGGYRNGREFKLLRQEFSPSKRCLGGIHNRLKKTGGENEDDDTHAHIQLCLLHICLQWNRRNSQVGKNQYSISHEKYSRY